VLAALAANPRPAAAQLTGFNIKGDMGLKSGSQAPPGGYATALFYRYGSDTITTKSGLTASTTESGLTMGMGVGVVTFVTTKKIFGANYGFTLAPVVVANMAIESARFGHNPDAGFSDIFMMPISLGWHLTRADVTTTYAIFMPTGRYEPEASNNTSLDMWGHEWALGATAYLTESKSVHLATNAAFEFHTGKRHSDAHVGTLLTLEGGLGRSFLKGAASVGVAYYAQWKLTEDTLSGVAAPLVQGKNRVFALGPEVNLPIATKKKLLGFFTFRYEWETYARSTLQGDTLAVLFTFLLKPMTLPAK